jgi:hypothetical protein
MAFFYKYKSEQEVFLWFQTPTSFIRLRDEKWRIRVYEEGWMIKGEWWRVKQNGEIFIKFERN